jgi:alkanesulfonate monooxygenase SsuD/methylene tetrahydromethanopterin reductase-like flavin-dependent oxidoreductase (luciferase family)
VLLAYLAARTTQIRLGAGVAVLSLRRDAIATIEEFAMVDVLSGGRLDIGVGRGFMDHEFAGKGIPFNDRGHIFDHGLELLDSFFTGQLDEPKITPQPIQTRVPLWLAVSTNLESCRRAAAGGHGLMLNPYNRTYDETRAAIETYLGEWSRQDHQTGPRILVNQLLFVAPSEEVLRSRVEAALNSYLMGVTRALQSGNAAYHLPSKQFIDLYPEKVFFGTPDRVVEKIAVWQRLGVTDISLMTHFGDPVSRYADESTELFVEEVMPAFAKALHE